MSAFCFCCAGQKKCTFAMSFQPFFFSYHILLLIKGVLEVAADCTVHTLHAAVADTGECSTWSAVQYNTVQCSTVQHSTAQYAFIHCAHFLACMPIDIHQPPFRIKLFTHPHLQPFRLLSYCHTVNLLRRPIPSGQNTRTVMCARVYMIKPDIILVSPSPTYSHAPTVLNCTCPQEDPLRCADPTMHHPNLPIYLG